MSLLAKIETYDLARYPSQFSGWIDSRSFVEASEAAKELIEVATDPSNPEPANGEDSYSPEEIKELQEVVEQINDLSNEISEFYDGNTLVPENEWESYARQLADDIGAIPDDSSWPCTCIDWERAARELAMDYTLIDIDGTDYYARS